MFNTNEINELIGKTIISPLEEWRREVQQFILLAPMVANTRCITTRTVVSMCE